MREIRRKDDLKGLNLMADLAGADARGCDFWGIDIPEGARIKGLVIEQWQIPFLLRALGVRLMPDSSPPDRKSLPAA